MQKKGRGCMLFTINYSLYYLLFLIVFTRDHVGRKSSTFVSFFVEINPMCPFFAHFLIHLFTVYFLKIHAFFA